MIPSSPHRPRWPAAVVLAGLIGLAGCGESEPDTHPVRGEVKFADGKPLTGGTVMFYPLDDGATYTPEGQIEEDGSFTIQTTQEDDGAPVGKYRVIIMTGEEGQGGEPIDDKFADPEATDLEVEVTPGENVFTLTVTPADPRQLRNGDD